MKPVRLRRQFYAKPWGRQDLSPLFPPAAERIGEVWFTGERKLPILVKFLFTSDRLSVQVHPDDRDGAPGKTEMWYILRAEPGAAIAAGFRERCTAEQVRAAALSGEIVDMLQWFPVTAGQVFFAPAHTVHAIGAGIVLCEIQQNSDVTYRLYDYGSARDLHLEQAMAVADFGPHPGESTPEPLGNGRVRLACCPHFVTESLEAAHDLEYGSGTGNSHLLVCLEGSGLIAGQPFEAGEVWHIPPAAPPFHLAPANKAKFLRTYVPAPTGVTRSVA